MEIMKGDVLLVKLNENNFKNVVVIQNNTGNQHSNTLIVSPIIDEKYPVITDTIVESGIVETSKITTIDKSRVIKKYKNLTDKIEEITNNAIMNLGYDLHFKKSQRHCNRGDIVYIPFKNSKGSEQQGLRPAMVLQNNIGNQYGKTTIVIPLTSKPKKKLPTHYKLKASDTGIDEDSTLLFEQIRTIDKTEIIKTLGYVELNDNKGIHNIVSNVLFR